jgi:hypothetical protein
MAMLEHTPPQQGILPHAGVKNLGDGWLMRVNSAGTLDDVLRVVNEFVDSWTRTDVAQMPIGCRPPEIRSAQDVSGYAFTLAQAKFESRHDLRAAMLLDRMATFFSYASTRVATLAHLTGASL